MSTSKPSQDKGGPAVGEVHWAAFTGLDPAAASVCALAAASERLKIKADTTLFLQDDQPDRVYLILSGAIKAVRFTQNGHEVWLYESGPGEVVGEVATLDESPRIVCAIAVTDCEVLAVPARKYRAVIDQDPAFARFLLSSMATRLRFAAEQIEHLASLTVYSRLHAELVRLSASTEGDNELLILKDPPAVSQLAKQINATREATSRALSALKRRGLVIDKGQVWHVLLPETDQSF